MLGAICGGWVGGRASEWQLPFRAPLALPPTAAGRGGVGTPATSPGSPPHMAFAGSWGPRVAETERFKLLLSVDSWRCINRDRVRLGRATIAPRTRLRAASAVMRAISVPFFIYCVGGNGGLRDRASQQPASAQPSLLSPREGWDSGRGSRGFAFQMVLALRTALISAPPGRAGVGGTRSAHVSVCTAQQIHVQDETPNCY